MNGNQNRLTELAGEHMFFKASFSKSLRKAMVDLANYPKVMERCVDDALRSEDDAQAVVEALDKLIAARLTKESGHEALHSVIAFFQESDSKDATAFLRKHGIPRLIRLLETHWNNVDLRDDLMFCLKQLGIYQTLEGVPIIVRAMREWPDGYMWKIILDTFAMKGAPQKHSLIRLIGNDLPSGFAGIAYLDVVNTLSREDGLAPHPFASEQGVIRLKALLKEQDSDSAISATAALPFLPAAVQSELFSRALEHINWEVQVEAAWAMAHSGNERGYKLLVEYAKDVHKYDKVARYLHELGRDYLLPPETQSSDFQAMAEMSQWLQHPSEMRRVPDELTLYDTREVIWPPTNDQRRVWLFRYLYRAEDGQEPDEGLGMVGSVTFALFGETTANLKPEEAYALHCCWELQNNEDPLAPKERDIAAGLKILRKYNPGF